MYKRGDIIFKKLKTLENMGRLDCLVFEKSGTLTQINESFVRRWWTPGVDVIVDEVLDYLGKVSADDNTFNTTNTHYKNNNNIIESIWYNTTAWIENDL